MFCVMSSFFATSLMRVSLSSCSGVIKSDEAWAVGEPLGTASGSCGFRLSKTAPIGEIGREGTFVAWRGSTFGRKVEFMSPMPTKKSSKML